MGRLIEAIVEHPVRSAVAATTAPVVALVINCGGGDNAKPTPDDIKSPTGTVLETNTPMPSATAIATQVIESPSPEPTPTLTEIPASVPCEILEQQYCSQGKILNSENLFGTKIKLLGFHLPEGAPIFAPYNGSLSTGKGNTFNKDSLNATVSNPDDQSIPVFTVIGDLRYPSSSSFYPVKKGEIVAYAQNAGITVLGDYNVVITFSIKDPNKGTLGTDEAILKQLFPNLFQP